MCVVLNAYEDTSINFYITKSVIFIQKKKQKEKMLLELHLYNFKYYDDDNENETVILI